MPPLIHKQLVDAIEKIVLKIEEMDDKLNKLYRVLYLEKQMKAKEIEEYK